LTDLVFFYGTLMSAFRRSNAEPVAVALTPLGQGWFAAALFDLGAYPGAIPSSRVFVENCTGCMIPPRLYARSTNSKATVQASTMGACSFAGRPRSRVTMAASSRRGSIFSTLHSGPHHE
jgi:hypothetical protein